MKKTWILLSLLLLTTLAAPPLAAQPQPATLVLFDSNYFELTPGYQLYIGTANAWTPMERDFRIHNRGDATLTVFNPTTFFSGTGYSIVRFPAASIAPRSETTFRIRFQHGVPGDYTGVFSIQSNSATNSTYVASLVGTAQNAPHLRVTDSAGSVVNSDAQYNVGSVAVGSSLQKTFTFTNDGTASLSINLNANFAPSFTLLKQPASPLAPGQSDTAIVSFNPTVVGLITGSYRFTSNAAGLPNSPYYSLSLLGTGLGAKVRVISGDNTTVNNGGTYVYPTTTQGTIVSRAFTIHNDGNQPMTVSGYGVSSPDGGFTSVLAPPATIAAGSSGVFRVRLNAGQVGTFNGTVSFNTNAPGATTFSFNLRGTVQSANPPDIRIVSGDGITITSGMTYSNFPTTTVGVSVSRAFTIYNDGASDLIITNPAALVSGSGFSLIQTPATPIAAGTSTVFRVRLQSATAGTKTGTVTVQSNDPDENPITFTIRGVVQ